MSDITLIQLVSGQAMPNLLAAMALQPARIVHLCTATEATRRGANALLRAYKAAGLQPLVITETLSPMPMVPEVKNAVSSLMENDASAVLNFTGGTKLMSLGAFTAALALEHTSFYVDTDNNVFVDGHTSAGFASLFPDGDISITRIKKSLSVPIIAIANGAERVTAGNPWQPFLPLATFLLENPGIEDGLQKWADKTIQSVPRNWHARKDAIAELFEVPVPADWPGALPPAIQSGIFEERGGQVFPARSWLRDLAHGRFKVGSPEWMAACDNALFPFSFFQGVWWEVATIDYLSRHPRYRALQWSANVGARGDQSTDKEEDILGIADGIKLLYVSCKRGGARDKLSRTLEELAGSARGVGGIFAEKILAVCLKPNSKLWTQLINRSRQLDIRILTRADVLEGAPL